VDPLPNGQPAAARGEAGPAVPGTEAILSRAASENFPVAPRWLPRARRRDLMAIYGFARLVDELGDEAPGDRMALLDALEADLDRAFAGAARIPLLAELSRTIRAHDLPREPFARLVEANRRDQRVTRCASWAELEDYCRLSANPVGELVLHLFGVATPERVALSDAICTALQLVEHCQDVGEDAGRGRIYLPADERARFGVAEADLRRAPAPARLRDLLAFQAARARALLGRGEPLLRRLPAVARIAVAGYAAGGHAALDALERAHFDATSRTATARRRDVARHTVRLLRRARGRAGSSPWADAEGRPRGASA
jgi:squalene synthase HpnC